MGRKTHRKPAAGAPLPAVELMGPTDEQRRHAEYDRGEIVHAESFTRATVHRVRQASSLARMLDDGRLTMEQYGAALDIARVAEMIERSVAVRCASLEARVDNQGSSRDVLIENLTAARLEVAYTAWRQRLPMPKRMVIDMVLADRSLKATARVYRMGWPRAMSRLRDALDTWIDERERAWRQIDAPDLERAQARIAA